MERAALRGALLQYALDPRLGDLEDRYNALTLSVLNEAFPFPSYAVTVQEPFGAVRRLRDASYGVGPLGSPTTIAGPSPHRRSLSGLYYESTAGSPFGLPTGERQRDGLESVDSTGASLGPESLRKPDFVVLSFGGRRVKPRVVMELKAPSRARDKEALGQILDQTRAVVAPTRVVPRAFPVRGTTRRCISRPP